MTRIPFLLILTLLLSLLARSAPANTPLEGKAVIFKSRSEQTLTLPVFADGLDSVKIEITPSDSVLLEQEQRILGDKKTVWIGIWSEGNRGRHLRAWFFSPKSKRWSETPFADVPSDLKVNYAIEGDVLVIQAYTLQDDQSLSPVPKKLRFALPTSP